jgi:uncharacterized delta-60 repeat protein
MQIKAVFSGALTFLLFGVTAATSQVTDNKSTNHIFAQIADGRFSDGSGYSSTLVISSDASTATTCTATLAGLTIPGFGDGRTLSINVLAGRVAAVETPGTQSGVRSGYLSLACTAPVAAQVLYAFRSSTGVVLGEATVFSSPAATVAQLFVDQRNGSQLGIAVANPSSTAKEIVIVANDQTGTEVGKSSVQLAAGAQTARFLSDLVQVPPNFRGPVQIYSNSTAASDIYAIGLRFNGAVFTTIPSVLREQNYVPPPPPTGLSAVGALDTSFNTTGQVRTTFGTNNDIANAVALQADGKIVVAGTTGSSTNNSQYPGASNDFALARYNADGSLDASFDTDGKVTTFIVGANSKDVANALAIQTDGKIVAAGSADNSFALVRYNINGSLDQAFGTGGKVTTSFCADCYYATASAVVVQTDGKIVAVGSRGLGSYLVRYNSNGSLDLTFGTGGIVAGISEFSNAVAIQTDGKLVVAGSSSNYFTLVRYNSNGSLDTTFGTAGVVSGPIGPATAVLIQTDGKIVAAGGIGGPFSLFRYNTDGSLETIFERATGANYGLQYTLRAIAIQKDGKFVTAGYVGQSTTNRDFVVRRHNADGSIDTTFGTGGIVVTPTYANGAPSTYYSSGPFDGGRAMVIQTDGKIVVAGTDFNGTDPDFAIVRYQ